MTACSVLVVMYGLTSSMYAVSALREFRRRGSDGRVFTLLGAWLFLCGLSVAAFGTWGL